MFIALGALKSLNCFSSMKCSDLRQPLFMTFKAQAISIKKISIYPFYTFETMLKKQ